MANRLTEFRRRFIRKKDLRIIFLRIIRLFSTPSGYKDPYYVYRGVQKIKTSKGSFRMNATGGSLENEIFWKGIYNSFEPETLWLVEKLAPIVGCMVDIGANTGLYSLFVKSNNPNCVVHCFEPAVSTFEELKANIKLNENDNIYLNNIAVSNKNGQAKFYDTYENHQYSASLSPKMLKENPYYHFDIKEYMVDVCTLDQYTVQNKIDSVDLIKMDVELHEPEVFEGMTDVINRAKPFIIFEVLTDEIGNRLHEQLRHHGYDIFYFKKSLGTYHLINVVDVIKRSQNEWNYFACHKSRLNDLIHLNLF
jgi:FkbM family methyltransferase